MSNSPVFARVIIFMWHRSTPARNADKIIRKLLYVYLLTPSWFVVWTERVGNMHEILCLNRKSYCDSGFFCWNSVESWTAHFLEYLRKCQCSLGFSKHWRFPWDAYSSYLFNRAVGQRDIGYHFPSLHPIAVVWECVYNTDNIYKAIFIVYIM